MELREKIIETLQSVEGYRGLEHERQADAILSLPEIKEALEKVRPERFGEGDIYRPIANP